VPFRPRVHWKLTLVTAAQPAQPELVEPVADLLRRVVRDAARGGAWPARPLAAAPRA